MSLEQQIGALVKASENLTGAVNGKIGEIDKTVTQKVKELDQKFEEEKNAFYSLGNFKNVRMVVPWVGDGTHYVYLLLHMEPSADENPYADSQSSGLERYGFGQYGEIYIGRITSDYSAIYFGRFSFHSVRGFGDASSAIVATSFTYGIQEPAIVKNFPHDGKLFRAVRFSPQSYQSSGISISVNYNGDFRGTGSAVRNYTKENPYWLKTVGVAKDSAQPGEVISPVVTK